MNPELVKAIKQHASAGIHSLHGPDHWNRVTAIGLALAERAGANKNIVNHFGQLHDIGRVNDETDLFHGIESAHFCKANRHLIDLDDKEFEKLIYAIARHPMGKIIDDIDIGTCWDADRCDITRTGIDLDIRYISTSQAKEPVFLKWATTLYLDL